MFIFHYLISSVFHSMERVRCAAKRWKAKTRAVIRTSNPSQRHYMTWGSIPRLSTTKATAAPVAAARRPLVPIVTPAPRRQVVEVAVATPAHRPRSWITHGKHSPETRLMSSISSGFIVDLGFIVFQLNVCHHLCAPLVSPVLKVPRPLFWHNLGKVWLWVWTL